MKDIKLFNKILLSIGIIFIILILILLILGNINREGYLSELNINIDETLKLNNIENTKKLFSRYNGLDYSSLTNYIFTNSNISNYSYNFRISYYSKVFRNSDIYGVYLNTNSLANYIKNIKFEKKGSPFGILISDELIEGNIDNIQYSLKIKFSFYIMILLIFIVLSFLTYILRNFILNLLTFLSYIINSNITKYVFVLIIFLCFLIIPNILYFLFGNYFDKTNYENRLKAEKPILSVTNIINYPVKYEKYFNDYLPFRNELIQLKNSIDIGLFQNIISDKVLLGKDNWLFYKGDNLMEKYMGLNTESFTDEELITAKNDLIYFRDELKKRNIDFILMICPDKNFIYEEKLPNYVRKKTNINYVDKFVDYMNRNTDIKIVYPKEELLKYKDKYQLYYKYDTHWNLLGGYIGYSELMKKMHINTTSLDNLTILNPRKVSGDLAVMINAVKQYYNDYYYNVNYETNYRIIKTNNIPYKYVYVESDSINNNKLLMFEDSYFESMFDYIVSSFYKSTSIYVAEFNYNHILNENPNIVVFEIVSRELEDALYLIHYHNIKMLEEINKDFNTNNIITNN